MRRGATVVVGFSAGPDSLALAAALGRVAPVLGLNLLLVHVDHRLRAESPAEQTAAAALAADLGLAFRARAIDEVPSAAHPGVGPEEAVRRERYRLLAETCREVGAACLALAHHRDDQAETVLLHLLRGAGLTGARAMAEWVVRPVPWWHETAGPPLALWRPLLAEPRVALRAYVGQRQLAPLADPSNDDPTFRRNALRHRLLPLLDEIQPGAAATLARYAELVAADDEALDVWAESARAAAADADGSLRLASLRDVPVAIARRVVRQWLAAAVGRTDVPAERVDALLGRGARGGRLEIGEGVAVVAQRGRLRVECGGEESA